MDSWIQREPPEMAGRAVSEAVRGQRMTELVHREPHEQDDRDRDQGRDKLRIHETSVVPGTTRTW